MAGKISDAEKNMKIGSKFNSNMVKISSSKSILSYQNGSGLKIESRECTADEGVPGDEYSEETSLSEEPSSEDQNLKSECLDILRKKLISDLSLTVFSSDLENKLAKMEPIEISKERQTVIQKLVIQISQLSDAEKLLLYLKLPSSTSSPFDPLRQPLNPLGNRQEIQQTIVWIKTHLEEDREISIPKQDVYDQYLKYCENVSMKPLSTADFGKVMKQVYPGVRPRRLGTRGNSRYCYSGMRNTSRLPTPILPQSSTENSIPNGSAGDGSSLSEPSKNKRAEKAKRKWKTSACPAAAEAEENCLVGKKPESAKRARGEEGKEGGARDSAAAETAGGGPEKTRGKPGRGVQEVDVGWIKSEESSDNSFGAFDVECGLDGNFGIYFKGGTVEGEAQRCGAAAETSSSAERERKQLEKRNPIGEKGSRPATNGEQGEKPVGAGSRVADKTNRSGDIPSAGDQQKTSKGRTRRSASFSKTPKNPRKCYVPIQPKPAEVPKQSVRFETPLGLGGFPQERKKEANGLPFCEESDSQEPEEEIVRYFKHLDENEVGAGGFVDQAVKNLENSSVQISNMSQIASKDLTGYRGSEEVLSQATQQILRSQSCFEVQIELFNLGDGVESAYAPRSQSSVELPTSAEPTQQEATDSDSGLNGKSKKISHLRILLEKSISSTGRNVYSVAKGGSDATSGCGPAASSVPPSHSLARGAAVEANRLLSQGKPLDQDPSRPNGSRAAGKGPSLVPQSPNNRTKYFSFTPISPGPHSPLKTPSTPSASPFVSPRNTPVPRSRQNSNNDFFLSPSERKSAALRPDGGGGKSEFFSDTVFNFSKGAVGKARAEGNLHQGYLPECRPRSFSSTNFCRSKGRRTAPKSQGYDPGATPAALQSDLAIESPFSVHKNFVSSDSLSEEVRKFLENNSRGAEDQSASIRSQSVPLNRMMSESTWIPAQVSSLYPSYFGSGTASGPPAPLQGKFPEWVAGSETSSPKDLAANASPFLTDGEMPGLEGGPLPGEVFSGDPTVGHLGDQYFPGGFHPGAEETFSETDPFSNKLDVNPGGAFEGTFASDSDPAIPDSIKSYLPDFGGLENKGSAGEGEGEGKLFKNVLYERGGENPKDPVITSFKPVLANEMAASPASPASPGLHFFGTKIGEDNQQLIEFFDFEN